MDRIYYFRLAREKAGKRYGSYAPESVRLPVFHREIAVYDVYYLQMYMDTEVSELESIQAYMAKAIQRLAAGEEEKGEFRNARLVYEARFEKWLRQRHLEKKWEKLWDMGQYNEYREVHNLMLLLERIEGLTRPKQLVILGEAPGMQDWIGSIARYVKNVTFFSRTEPRGFAEAREMLLEEYGMLAVWKHHLQPTAKEPALVLDYCGEEKLYIWGTPAGSIWIDMTSMEERRHALADRETGIHYLSLKSIWEEEMSQTLDTASKIKYNT